MGGGDGNSQLGGCSLCNFMFVKLYRVCWWSPADRRAPGEHSTGHGPIANATGCWLVVRAINCI